MKVDKFTKFFFFSHLILLMAINIKSDIFGKELDLLKEKSFTVKAGQILKVQTDAGDIIIKTWNNDEVFVKIYGDNDAKRKMEFSFDQDENGVTVIGEKEGGNIFNWFSSVDLKYEILVPTKFDLNLKTSGGDLSAMSISGKFNLKTSGGDIYLKNSSGNTAAATSGGDIVLAVFSGDAELSTSGGDIKADGENGKIYANTSGGDIFIETSNGEVVAKTSGGDIDLIYSGENMGIELKTSGGDIDVKIPSNFDANVDIRTSGGDINNQFSNNRMSKITKSTLVGEFNNGGREIICKTSGGDITIFEK